MRALDDIRATAHFDFLYGRFSISKWKIPYFVTTVSFEDAANDLRLASEVPGADEISWSIDELYQRDVDWHRVEQRITPYLRDTENPQFFNSITIALLPYDPATAQTVDQFSNGVAWQAPNHDTKVSYGKELVVGPISLGFWDDWQNTTDPQFRSGRMRWNRDQVFAVAIDGQHRLAAIKAVAATNAASPAIAQSRVPVIFIIFDKAVGYEGPYEKPTVEVLRQLFIDLNKHAQTVTRGRQILLDDRDPHSLCVRSLIEDKLSENLNALGETPPHLPLSLIDWHSDQAKFESGPYLATVLGMDWLVSQVLETKPIRDFTDYGSVAAQIKKLQGRLGIELTASRERLEDLERFQMRPFSYPEHDLESIQCAFADVWNEPLVKILTQFQPYAGLIARRNHDATLSLDHQQWFRLWERRRQDPFEGKATQEYKQFLGRVATRTSDPISEAAFETAATALDEQKAENLAFNVAFQRALFWGFLEYAKLTAPNIAEIAPGNEDEDVSSFADLDVPEDDVSDGEDSAEEEFAEPVIKTKLSVLKRQYSERADEFVLALNRIVQVFPAFLELGGPYTDAECGAGEFWAGTLLRKPEDAIDFTQAASKRARDLIFLAAGMVLYDNTREPDIQSNFEDFWLACTEDREFAITDAIGRSIYRYAVGESSAAGRAIRARGDEYTEERGYQEVSGRARFLWNALQL